MTKLSAKDRNAITQRVGAVVHMDNERGIVVGHYDDDIVFIQFDGETSSVRVYVSNLKLESPAADLRFKNKNIL